MVKRSRSESTSSTESEDTFEPLPAAGPTRSAEDEAGLPPKRRRLVEPEKGPLEHLPPEIRAQIIRELVDPKDWLNSLKAIERLRRTGSTFNQDVAELLQDPDDRMRRTSPSARARPASGVPQRTNPILGPAGKLLAYKTARLENLPIQSTATTRAEFALQDNVFKCDLIPVIANSENSTLTRDVLRSRNTPLKYDALDSLALNVAYLEPHDRAALVRSVCTLHKELVEDDVPAGLGRTVRTLIERAEHLSSLKQGQLLDATLDTADPATKTQYLEAFAGKIDAIAGPDLQERVVNAIVADQTAGTGYRLGLLAGKLDRISHKGFWGTAFDSPREKTARAILALDRADAGRLWAMSKLVEKLDSVAPQTIPEVTSVAAEELNKPIVEPYEEGSDRWHSEPSICRVEIAHHLSMHSNLLAEGEAARASDFIRDVLTSSDNHRAKAQLLPHMRPKARRRFVERRLPDDADVVVQNAEREEIAQQVAEGMTLRVKDLDKGEKATCAFYLSSVLSADRAENALKYTISSNLPHFNREDANQMARQAISNCKDMDPASAVAVFSYLARQAVQLDTATVAGLVRTSEKMTGELIEDAEPEENTALRSLAVFAAQAVADKSREILVKGTSGLEEHLRKEGSHTRRGYDDRAADRVR